MPDSALRPLHHRRRTWLPGGDSRSLVVDGGFAAALVLSVVALFAIAPEGSWAPAWQVACLFVAASVAAAVRFEVGAGWSSPMQLAQVPLWLAVPPAWLPVIVAASLVLGQVVEQAREGHRPDRRVLLAADDTWHAVGAAVALSIVGPQPATLEAFPMLLIVLAGQVGLDTLYGVAQGRLAFRLPYRELLRSALWVGGVDLALLPVGCLAAYALATEPSLAVSLVPLIFLFAEFAREREERVMQSVELRNAYRGTAQLMTAMLREDDGYTGGEHTRGVVELALAVGMELDMGDEQLGSLELGAMLHDIGKIYVPNEILNKPGKLDAREWQVIREHPVTGQKMLDTVGGLLSETGHVVRAHHERFDGTGYPDGLRGTEIPLEARVITVCDSFSAMTTDRPYREAMTAQTAVGELDRCSGTQFDPRVVAAMHRVLAHRGQILTVARMWSVADDEDAGQQVA
ncbi:MAG: HD-GYP domain-containing protein [Solirubrobacteraceae bacterium]|nr:HD-GYP domain-containing protein [Solirubrobacteraceae bacterium]